MENKGFTLAELLIALAILGVIATFTIPKVLSSQQDERYKSIAKEAAGTITSAYSAYRLNNQPGAGTRAMDLTPFMNYVKVDSLGTVIDAAYTGGSFTCDNSAGPCLQLHNGAYLLCTGASFSGTATTNATHFYLDPDAKYAGSTNGPGKSVEFLLYYDGRLTTRENYLPGTCSAWACPFGASTNTPPWFSW